MKNIITSLLLALSFGLVAATASAHAKDLKPEFVDTLIPAYLDLQTALAADDLSAAQSASKTLIAAAANGPKFTPLTDPVSQIVATDNIKSARQHFLTASNEMISLVDHVGTTGGHELFVAHCPMAFGGQGGTWLQGDRKVNNPYYGSMMLRCGTIKSQAAEMKMSRHGKHAHQSMDKPMTKLEPASAELIAEQGPNYPNVCVVSDEALVADETLDYSYQGQLLRFCCKKCRTTFMKEPASYLTKLAELKKAEKPTAHAHQH